MTLGRKSDVNNASEKGNNLIDVALTDSSLFESSPAVSRTGLKEFLSEDFPLEVNIDDLGTWTKKPLELGVDHLASITIRVRKRANTKKMPYLLVLPKSEKYLLRAGTVFYYVYFILFHLRHVGYVSLFYILFHLP